MTLCLSYCAPSLTLLLASTLALPGCIDPKSLGTETDDASESGDADSGQTTTGGPGTQTDGPGTDTDNPGTDTDDPGTDTDGPETDTAGGCPPIDHASCLECFCIDDDWQCDPKGCIYDCAGLECGTSCMMCPDDSPGCTESEYEGVCTAGGECVGVPPPKQGFCEGLIGPGFEAELDAVSGCADMVVYAHDAADERGLVLSIDQNLVADAVASGMPVHVELPATDPDVNLEVRAGILVTNEVCNDALRPGMEIDEIWLPTAGTVIVDIVPDELETANATVELQDVELQRQQPGPESITFSMTMSDVYVGWLPG